MALKTSHLNVVVVCDTILLHVFQCEAKRDKERFQEK